MNCRFLLVFLFLFASMFINAQDFNGGLNIGIAGSQISGDNLSGFNKGGIFAGAFANIYFSTRGSFQLELNYIQKGSRKNQNPEKNDYKIYKLNLQYIEVPVVVRFDYNRRLTFELGPYFGFLLKSSEKDESGEFPEEEEFRKTDIGLLTGIGYSVNDNIIINIRLEQSVLVVRDHTSGAHYRLNRGQYNTSLILAVRYQL